MKEEGRNVFLPSFKFKLSFNITLMNKMTPFFELETKEAKREYWLMKLLIC